MVELHDILGGEMFEMNRNMLGTSVLYRKDFSAKFNDEDANDVL